MTERTAGRVANGALAITFLFLAASSFPPLRQDHSGDPGYIGYVIGIVVGFGCYLAIGRAIVRRDPGNTIGWLLLLIPLVTSFSLTVGVFATTALVDRPGSLPLGVWSAWLDRWLLPAVLSSFIFMFLLFPDGHLPSRRWRPALFLTVAGTGLHGMAHRLDAIGGDLDVESTPGRGTVVRGRVPVGAEEGAP